MLLLPTGDPSGPRRSAGVFTFEFGRFAARLHSYRFLKMLQHSNPRFRIILHWTILRVHMPPESAKIAGASVMPTCHIVEQGEHLSKIAADYGFRDSDTIWHYPDNAELKAKRKTPHILF